MAPSAAAACGGILSVEVPRHKVGVDADTAGTRAVEAPETRHLVVEAVPDTIVGLVGPKRMVRRVCEGPLHELPLKRAVHGGLEGGPEAIASESLSQPTKTNVPIGRRCGRC